MRSRAFGGIISRIKSDEKHFGAQKLRIAACVCHGDERTAK